MPRSVDLYIIAASEDLRTKEALLVGDDLKWWFGANGQSRGGNGIALIVSHLSIIHDLYRGQESKVLNHRSTGGNSDLPCLAFIAV